MVLISAKKKTELQDSDLFPHLNRNKLRNLTLQKSENIKEENLIKLKNRNVYLSLNGSKLCHRKNIDVIVYGYSTIWILESFLLKTTDAKDYSTKTFVDIGIDAIKEMKNYNCRVRAFIIIL